MKIYLVGGAVRDGLMGKRTSDYDYVVVGATKAEMESKFGHNVGASFPVFLAPNGDQYAMARREKKTGAGYLGFTCEADETITLAEDLMRRDLTINSMAKDIETGEIVDHFGGMQDLRNKILRHTSEAFTEDPLRVVRLARFYARFTDFAIARETLDLVARVVMSREMDELPAERYMAELEKLFATNSETGNAVNGLDRFFSLIHSLDAFKHVKFFRDVFGVSPDIERVMKFAREMQFVPEELRLTVFIALAGIENMGQLTGMSLRVMDLHRNVNQLRRMREVTADSVYVLMRSLKAWQQGDAASDLAVSISAGGPFAIDRSDLHEFVTAVNSVKSEFFPGVQGKELGQAIELSRKAAIQQIIWEWQDE